MKSPAVRRDLGGDRPNRRSDNDSSVSAPQGTKLAEGNGAQSVAMRGWRATKGFAVAHPVWFWTPIICLALLAMALTAFWPITHADFCNFDDPAYIYENDHVKQGFTPASVKWAFTAMIQYNWHPLAWLSHMADAWIFGTPPPAREAGGSKVFNGHHTMNLVFHLINSIVLFLLLQWLTRSTWCSAAVAALFAVHPMHVESVAWASERKDQLSTLIGFATIAVYAIQGPPGGVRPLVDICTAVLGHGLGQFSGNGARAE